ncbi:transposase [Chryseobacterium sp.]|jgi:hypothetical protein|uniref:transposase n=1 Tax=Chryseobacterium sp. TaxID=1871047 RepID=UPI0028490B6A|nr:transposase [Chryseobacterium sp.]MDR3023078.1 transposase [Chryseobacterium sp.]
MKEKRFEDINMGILVKERTSECEITMERICNFFKCPVSDVEKMYLQKSLDSEVLLKWCKLLEYDFFRIYSAHLILYSPPSSSSSSIKVNRTKLPQFKKNIYTQEIINFILELIVNEEKTKAEIIEEYKIPRTTLYKWMTKYSESVKRYNHSDHNSSL